MSQTIRDFDVHLIKNLACEKAAIILERTHESASALLKAFDLVRTNRTSAKATSTVGMTTDEEQDILRAMLVMAAAGLDSMTKQLIRDALPLMVHGNNRARDGLEKFLGKQLANDVELINAGKSAKFVAMLLSAADLPKRAASQYVGHLTSGSLQSAEELLRIDSAFGLTQNELRTNFQSLKDIFEVRNKIIHELDINLDAERRKRNIRSKPKLVKDANALLAAGEDLLRAVDRQLLSVDV